MKGDELFDYVQGLSSREDFLKFLEYFTQDYKEGFDEWENRTLTEFIGGLTGFVSSMDGYYKNMGEAVDVENPTWRMVAEMLLAATVYSG